MRTPFRLISEQLEGPADDLFRPDVDPSEGENIRNVCAYVEIYIPSLLIRGGVVLRVHTLRVSSDTLLNNFLQALPRGYRMFAPTISCNENDPFCLTLRCDLAVGKL